VDLYCGTGDAAEAVAGRLKHPGNLYIVLKKIDEPADVLE
jgi:membrane-bound lytic murein transglycosylase